MDLLLSRLPSIGVFRPLRGSFSAYQQLEVQLMTGEVLAQYQETGPCPTTSITDRCGMRQAEHQPWPVFWVLAEKPRLAGRLLHWRDFHDRICAEGCYHQTERLTLDQDSWLAQVMVPPARHLEGAWTSISSQWCDGGNYYHWMLDGLTRLMIREKLPETTRVLIPQSTRPYVRETLDLLGIGSECEMFEDTCLSPERFYFCSPLAMTGAWNPLGFDWLRFQFRPYFRPKNCGRPVFLTRRAELRVPEQIIDIERIFSESGFDILECANLTVRGQIEMVSGAPAIAGIHGAAMTNILWAYPATPILEIFLPAYLNGCYEQIAFQGKLQYSACVLEGVSPLSGIKDWLSQF